MKKAIVVVDMQNDFVDGALGTAEAQAMLPRMVEKLTAARAAGTALVFTMDTHGADYLTTQEGEHLPVPHCIRGTAGWAIVEAAFAARRAGRSWRHSAPLPMRRPP